MSDIIQLLPDSIANQIAAGEVVQRPASAVKELLENAIDAGAKNIQLIIKDSGKSLIQVIDDGMGMSETDARMCLERHATSKIKVLDDLSRIFTFGFRGEAIASIAAISRMELKSKRREDDSGTHIIVEASTLKTQEPCAMPDGTNISIKNLFYNVPARRNFLKKNTTEFKFINDEFIRVAIANPEIGFRFFDGDHEVYHLNKASLKQRLVQVMGKKFDKILVPVEEETSILTVSGFIGKPEHHRKTRGEQFFFVNKRFIKNAYLNHAVVSAFEGLLPKDTFPFYCLFMDIDPAKVDVNVHPTKTEVKFEDERSIYAIFKATIKRALSQHHAAPSLDFDRVTSFDKYTSKPGRNEQNLALNTNQLPENSKVKFSKVNPTSQSDKDWEELYKVLSIEQSGRDQQEETDDSNELFDQAESDSKQQSLLLHQKYLLSPIRSGLMLVNLQKSLERIYYDKYRKGGQNKTSMSQKQLFPESINLNQSDCRILKEILPELNALGFEIEEFGKYDFLIKGLPASLPATSAKLVFEAFMEQYKNETEEADSREDAVFRSLAVTAASRRYKKLNREEATSLVDELFATEQPYYAPDGKPTFITIALSEFDKKFELSK